jgi:hypothetical protein
MRQLLIKAFKDTAEQIKADLAMMPLERWSESVFRFIYSRAVAKLEPDVTHFVECSRIDLVLHRKRERAFVEFKFYLHAHRYDPLCGNKIGWKGGPGRKNYREFKKCVQTLRRRYRGSKVLRLVALFYSDPVDTRRKTFDAYFGDKSGVKRKLKIRRLDSISPFASNGSESTCNVRLYEVRT